MLDEGKFISSAGDTVYIDGQALSLSVIAIIAKRMGMVDENTTYEDVRKWLASDSAEVQELLALSAAAMKEHASSAANALGNDSEEWAKKYYEQAGVLNSGVGSVALGAGIGVMGEKLDRICSTSVAGLIDHNGNFVPFSEGYKDAIDSIIRAFVSGKNVADEIKLVTQRLAQTGLVVQYADGRHMNIASAVRTTAETEIGKSVQSMRDAMGKEFGADGVEISAHSLCAPDHQPYQGRQYTNEEFEDIQSGLKRQIATGHNCRHTTRPIIVGVSSETYTEKQRKHMVQESNRKVTYTTKRGVKKEVTRYEATQVQRQKENVVRSLKMIRQAGKDAGVDVSDYDLLIKQSEREYRSFCQEVGLTPQKQRLDIYKLSN